MSAEINQAAEVLAEAIHREDHGARCNCRGLLWAAISAVSAAGAEALSAAGLLADAAQVRAEALREAADVVARRG